MISGGLGREYGKLFAARAVSNLGDGMTLVAGPLLAATLSRDPMLISLLAFSQRLPWLLFALVSGALVDRLERKRLMACVELFRTATIGFLGVAVMLDLANLPLMFAVFFLVGAAETLFDTASVSVLPSIVRREALPKANGRMYSAQIVANNLVGPPLGGLLFTAAAALPFLLDAGTFAAAAALILMLRGSFRARSSEAREGESSAASLGSEIAEGLSWLWRHRLLRTLALTIGVMNVTFGAVFAVWVLYAQERLGLGPVGYGLLAAAIPVGGVVGGLLADRVSALLGPGTTLRLGLVVEVATHVILASTTSFTVACAVLALFGFHAIVWGALSASLRQELVSDVLMGRVNSVYLLFDAGSGAIGAVIGGVMASFFGLTAPFWFAAVGVAVLLALVWRAMGETGIQAVRSHASQSDSQRS